MTSKESDGSLNDRELPRRSQELVNRKLQFYLLFYAGLFGLAYLAVLLGIDAYFDQKFQEALLSSDQTALVMDSVLQIRKQEMITSFVFSILFLTFWIAQGWIVSHRIAGPIYKTTQFLNDYMAGKTVTPLKFREHDFFHELAGAINKVLKLH